MSSISPPYPPPPLPQNPALLCPSHLSQTQGGPQAGMDGLLPRFDAPVFPEALISILLASRAWLNGWRITSACLSNEDSAGSGRGHGLIISRRRIYSDFGVTLPRPAPLLFIKAPHCPGQPWWSMYPGERYVRPGESQVTWVPPAQTRHKDRKTCPRNSCPTSSPREEQSGFPV